jgi:hypothetical protein
MSDPTSFRRGSGASDPRCQDCLIPDADDVRERTVRLMQENPKWSPRRCFDRAWIAALIGKPAPQAKGRS